MNPISSHGMTIAPWLRPAAAPSAADELGKIIPQSELSKLSQPSNLSSAGQTGGTSFAGVLGNMINDVSAKQAEAGAAMKGMVEGNGVQLHQAMIAVEEASVSFQLMVEVRNRLLESYQELMRMQV